MTIKKFGEFLNETKYGKDGKKVITHKVTRDGYVAIGTSGFSQNDVKDKKVTKDGYVSLKTVDFSDKPNKPKPSSVKEFINYKRQFTALFEMYYEKDENPSYAYNKDPENIKGYTATDANKKSYKNRIDHFKFLDKSLSDEYDYKHYGYDQKDRGSKGRFTDAINDHTLSSAKVTKGLHKNFLNEHTLPSSVQHLIKNTDEALYHAPSAPYNFHVYTGLKESPKMLDLVEHPKELKKTGEADDHYKVVLPSFTSASIDPEIAHSFTRNIDQKNHNNKPIDPKKQVEQHMLKIEIPAGSKHGSYIRNYSYHDSEREFLMKRGLKLHISKTPQIIETTAEQAKSGPDAWRHSDMQNNDLTNRKIHIWHAKIVDNHYGDENPSKDWDIKKNVDDEEKRVEAAAIHKPKQTSNYNFDSTDKSGAPIPEAHKLIIGDNLMRPTVKKSTILSDHHMLTYHHAPGQLFNDEFKTALAKNKLQHVHSMKIGDNLTYHHYVEPKNINDGKKYDHAIQTHQDGKIVSHTKTLNKD